MERLVSLSGLPAMIGLAWLMSSHKRKFPVQIVVGGLVLQFVFALLILKTTGGRALFDGLGTFFTAILGFASTGTEFVFGVNYEYGVEFSDPRPASRQLLTTIAFGVLPTIVFFSSLMSVLYYLGMMQWLVKLFAVVMQRTLKTSGAESLAAAANIFVGQTESPLVVRPYIGRMTDSELMSVMTGGFATIAGGVMAAYISFGIDPGHLITASVISAPAALLIAKVVEPETAVPVTAGYVTGELKHPASNIVEAAAVGASDGMKLALNVAAMLVAFLALIALLDAGMHWLGEWFGQSWSLAGLFGRVFYPLAWLMGVESEDCLEVGQLLGLKMAANEFVAYEQFSRWLQSGSEVQLAARSEIITTYALCGFANFGSIGIQIGGIGGIAPERRPDLARLGMRAMLGGTLACCMTGCIAGVLI